VEWQALADTPASDIARPPWLAALAGRPQQTEDAGILARSDCELEALLAQTGSGPERVLKLGAK
jgi:hypothetical protein